MDAGGPARQFTEVPKELIQRLERKVHNLQMLPAVAAEALKMAQDPDCPIGKFSGLIERDLKLATFILKVANGTLFSTGGTVASLHQAITRVGLRHCRGLILSSSFDSLSTKLTSDLRSVREVLARHGFLTAILAMRLNRQLNLGFQGEEFTSGLLHDLGRTLFAVAVPEQFRMIDPLSFAEPEDIEARETSAIGCPHTEFGAWFAATNDLPEPLISAIRYHHAPREAGSHRRLTALTAAADHMANHIQHHEQATPYDPRANAGIALLESSGSAGATRKFSACYVAILAEAPQLADNLMEAI
jgi:HD-like signal output (HDOD) protein